ncbi:hypothetical protein [Pseudoalteromonas ardens]|uniref:Uncharacterized protein n=1 Tax=Pseudoalteromonas rubra TaxID=43658 RepID=A0A0L0EWG2_9GAMM|nr:hypothetical protein [Pseudoalteromonas sp. R96]KNC68760.1 hypothetical protein AC626_02800 [Pseudoalteromonas rubra]MDK1310062.1 hypothetical protein [Pseudoalteromonas sp. R96]
MKKVIFGALLAATSFSALSASGWVTKDRSARVDFINSEPMGVRVYFSANDANNIGCAQKQIVWIDTSTEGGKRHYSTLLAAFMAGKNVAIYGNGCFSNWGTSYPKVQAINVYH